MNFADPDVVAIKRRLATQRPWKMGAYSSIVGLPITAQPDPTQNTINVCVFRGERAEAEANASLVMRALSAFDAPDQQLARITREMYASLTEDYGVLLAALQEIKRDNGQYNFGSKLVRIVDAALSAVEAEGLNAERGTGATASQPEPVPSSLDIQGEK